MPCHPFLSSSLSSSLSSIQLTSPVEQAARILIVKSTNHFFPAFNAIAREVIYVDTGLTHGSPYPSDPTKT